MNSFWKNKNVLVTGHTGFKGSWLVLFLKFFDANILGISSEKKEGVYELTNLSSVVDSEEFIDLAEDSTSTENRVASFSPDIIFHFAAQSLVIEGYKDPLKTVKSNIVAPVNLINAINKTNENATLVIATTDKVYKNPSKDNFETSELGGVDFYSNSKVSKELLIDAFINHPDFSKLNINKVRSGNVIGGGERAKNRLFTDLIQSFNNNLPIEIRNPKHIRPWQYILDSLYGYLLIAKNSYENNTSEVFNLNSEINNHYEVKQITELFKNFSEHDKEIVFNDVSSYKEVDILKINSSKAENDLKWKAKVEIPKIIELIIKWEEHHKKIQNPNYSFNEIESYLNI
jgi:CDP-glucose 4,6-dehydratase